MPNTEMPLLEGGKANVLRDGDASVLVFFRPNQERSTGALRELAECQKGLAGKPVHWVGIVSGSVPTEAATALVHETGFGAPVLVDAEDVLYGALGLALHPVVVIVGMDHKLAAFEPFRSLDFCTVVRARIRHVLREISDDELHAALEPPKAKEGGNGQIARRYRAFAEALFKAKNYDKALENVQKSIAQDPTFAPAHALLGEIFAAQGKCAEAVQAYDKALALDASSTSAREGLARCGSVR